MSRLSGGRTRQNQFTMLFCKAVATMNVRSSKPTALCRGSANALASPCASVKAILTAYSRTQGEVFYLNVSGKTTDCERNEEQ